jgi:hypothetical protein
MEEAVVEDLHQEHPREGICERRCAPLHTARSSFEPLLREHAPTGEVPVDARHSHGTLALEVFRKALRVVRFEPEIELLDDRIGEFLHQAGYVVMP